MARKADKQTKMPPSMQPWIEARKRFRLSHAQVQMARELGLNPQKLGNHDQEPSAPREHNPVGHLFTDTKNN